MSGHLRLVVTNAMLDGEAVSLTALDGVITAIGPDAGGNSPATADSSLESLDGRRQTPQGSPVRIQIGQAPVYLS